MLSLGILGENAQRLTSVMSRTEAAAALSCAGKRELMQRAPS